MAIARVNSATGSSTGAGSGTISTAAFSATAGNLIVVCWRGQIGSVGTPTDTAGNTYTLISSRTDNSGIGYGYMWYAYNIADNASNVVSISVGVLDYGNVFAVQYSGVKTSAAPLDTFTSETLASNATSFTSAAFSTANNGELIVAFATQNAAPTYTAGTNYSIVTTGQYSAVEERITTNRLTNTTASMSSTSSANWYFISACFIPAVIPTFNQGNMFAFF